MKIFRLFLTFLKLNIVAEMEFRANFVIRLLSQLLFVGVQVATIEIFFRFTSSIGNWSRAEVFVLAGLFRLIEGGFHIFLHTNLMGLSDIVRTGELDMYLVKPVNTLVLLGFSRQQWYELSTFFSGILFLVYFLPESSVIIWLNIFIFSILGLICLSSIILMFATLSFYMNRVSAISSVWDAISKVSRFPLDIFGRSLAPLLLVATIPTKIVLGKSGFGDIVIQIFGSAIFFIVAYSFWHYSLKHYSSASS
jgi:ABC-2 type transport system permease protein